MYMKLADIFRYCLSVQPSRQAIEQPLDLSIPENKMMLAFYLAAPEVENDRGALDVFFGMRWAFGELAAGTLNTEQVYRAPPSGDAEVCQFDVSTSLYNFRTGFGSDLNALCRITA